MSVERLNPDGVPRPSGAYSILSLVSTKKDVGWISGQVGRRLDNSMAGDIFGQTLDAFHNLEEILLEIELSPQDVVHMTTFLVGRSSLDGFRHAREEVYKAWFEDAALPSNTLIIVEGLAEERALVEIEAVVAGEQLTLE